MEIQKKYNGELVSKIDELKNTNLGKGYIIGPVLCDYSHEKLLVQIYSNEDYLNSRLEEFSFDEVLNKDEFRHVKLYLKNINNPLNKNFHQKYIVDDELSKKYGCPVCYQY